MRLATFNVLHGAAAGAEPRTWDPRDLPAAIAALDADVVALQEVDVGQPRSGGVDQAVQAAAAMAAVDHRFVPVLRGTPGPTTTGWTPVAAGAHLAATAGPDDGPAYGIALLTRFPARRWRVISFPAAHTRLPLLVSDDGPPRVRLVPDEPRAAVTAILDTPIGPVTVVAAHLSFVPGVNVRQLLALRRAVAAMSRPLVLLGDLNLPGSVPSRVTGFRSLSDVATYPASRPRVAFDHVLSDGLPDSVALGASATAMRLPISDHRALVVDLPFPPR